MIRVGCMGGGVVEMSKEKLILDHLQNALNQYWMVKHGYDFDSELNDEDGLDKVEVLGDVVEASNKLQDM